MQQVNLSVQHSWAQPDVIYPKKLHGQQEPPAPGPMQELHHRNEQHRLQQIQYLQQQQLKQLQQQQQSGDHYQKYRQQEQHYHRSQRYPQEQQQRAKRKSRPLTREQQINKNLIGAEFQDRKTANRPDTSQFRDLQDAWKRLHAYYVFDSMLPGKAKADVFQDQMRSHILLLIQKMDTLESRYYDSIVRQICAKEGATEDQYLLTDLMLDSLKNEVRQAKEELRPPEPRPQARYHEAMDMRAMAGSLHPGQMTNAMVAGQLSQAQLAMGGAMVGAMAGNSMAVHAQGLGQMQYAGTDSMRAQNQILPSHVAHAHHVPSQQQHIFNPSAQGGTRMWN